VRILIALSVLAGVIVPASSALAAGSDGIGILLADVLARSHDDPLARSYIVDRLAPGTSVTRRVEIVNSTRSPADVAVYPAAAGVRRGTFRFAPGHSRTELSSWTSVSRDVLRLQPGTRGFETVTIDVPQDASSGERYAVVWAEVSAPAPATGGVTLVNRVGIRMYLSIGPGARRLGAGDRAVRQTTARGPWQARMQLRSGLIQRVAVATIRFPRHAGVAKPPTAKVVPAGSSRYVMLAIVILGLVVVAALSLLLSRHRRRRGDLGIALPGH
jgi:hypothetical protein